MYILVLNAGSSSLKYALFKKDLSEERRGVVERIGIDPEIANHEAALEKALDELSDLKDKISLIGHRVVHGGEEFRSPTVIDKKILASLEKFSFLAPLHNPSNFAGIKACLKLLPSVKNVACFDTEFFKTLPEKAYLYALPFKFYEKYKIRRFGFHGLSHQFVAQEAAKKLDRLLGELNLITIHLGAGCSITAIKKGKAVDTSMGFTPLEGLMMGTRTGDIDPFIPIYLHETLGFSLREIKEILNFKSGILGIFEKSSDFRDLLEGVKNKNKKAILAFEMFCYRVIKYIGAYFAVLRKVDAIVFTGAIGFGDKITREKILEQVRELGDFRVFSIPTNEELMIAKKISSFL